MYKYSCRKCPIRSRCIDESNNASSTKLMIHHAFEAQTDTLATWALLQKNCLLSKTDRTRSASALSDRMQQARVANERPPPAGPPKPGETKKSVIRRLRPLNGARSGGERIKARSGTSDQGQGGRQPMSSPTETRSSSPLKRLSSVQQAEPGGPEYYWLTVESTKRHIALPVTGRLVLGRFDPNVGIPPDVDLSYEDWGARPLARRHIAISGRNGRHTIEDLGSKSGVFLNGKQMNNSSSYRLQPGDRIRLGGVQLLYDEAPPEVLVRAQTEQVCHVLLVTPTGRKLIITPPDRLVIGRADPRVTFEPDIDLSVDGHVARLVARRHALIHWRNGQPYLEDAGSRFGTRIGGELLTLGQAAQLRPGEHIWLGGCVLAYDIEFLREV